MKTIHTAHAPKAIGPYSQAIAIDGLLFTSGQVPLKADGGFADGDIVVQTNQVFDNLEAVLKEAGTSLQRVVKATVFVLDLNDFTRLNEVYAMRFGNHKPARSTVQVARLPRDAKVEIELVALL